MPYSAPAPGDVHVNRPLTNIAIAYMQDNANLFVADSVFPNVPVAKQSDAYFTFDRGEWNRDDVKERAPGTESAGGSFDIGQDTYFARVKAFHMDLNDQMIANQDSPLSLDQQATMYVMSKHMLHRELSWANTYFKTGVWTFEVEGNAAATAKNALNPDTTTNAGANDQLLFWNNAASTPIEDMRWLMTFQQQRTGFRPNKLVLGRPVWDVLQDHPAIIARMDRGQTTGAAKVNKAILASLLELDEVIVMDGVVNLGKQGLAEANSFIGGKHAMLVYAPAAAGLMLPSAGYTFSWTGFLGASNQGVRMKRFYMDALESTRVEGQQAFVQKLVAKDLAVFIKAIIQ